MSQGDAIRLMASIKQKEQYIARLRVLVEQAKRDQGSDVFALNAELKTQIAHGKILVERWNEIARLQREDQQYLIACAKRDEQIALRIIRQNIQQHIQSTHKEEPE